MRKKTQTDKYFLKRYNQETFYMLSESEDSWFESHWDAENWEVIEIGFVWLPPRQ